MTRRKTIIGIAAAIVLAGIASILLTGTSSAAPSAAAVQSDYNTASATVDANGFVIVPLADPIALVSGDVVALATITAPSAGLPNLPNSLRQTGLVVADNGTVATTDDTVTGVIYRVFGHQLRLDPNGNYRQNVYTGPITVAQKVTSGGKAYCAASPCS
jgi:hypothetical protein